MQVDRPENIRNVAITGHSDTGKTSLVSSLLYTSGTTTRLNRVDDGNTTTDFDAEEISRKISIGLATCFAEWKDHKINLIDCPGYGIFFDETQAGMRVAEATVVCVDGATGIEVTTEKIWNFAKEIELPVHFHLTKMDRERAELATVLNSLQQRFAREAVAVQLPIGSENAFDGVIDLIGGKAHYFKKGGDGKAKIQDVPDDMKEAVNEARGKLMEAVAESNLELLEQFFENGELTNDELLVGLTDAVANRRLFPVTLGAPSESVGTSSLLDTLLYLPSPTDRQVIPATNIADETVSLPANASAPLAALVFKTLSDPFSGKLSVLRIVSGTIGPDTTGWNPRTESVEKLGHPLFLQGKQTSQATRLVAGDIGAVAKLKNVNTGDTLSAKEQPLRLSWIKPTEAAISFAIEPKSKGDDEKIGEALHRLIEEDPTLHAGRDPETGEYLLSGAGQLHVEIAVAKLKSRYNVEVILHPPKVPYRETIHKTSAGHGRHKKQSGGRGQFADCKVQLEPLARGEDFEFVDEIFGGAIPQQFRPAVAKGIQEARERGFLAGYRVVDFRVRLQDGQFHDVDSSEIAFKIAGSLAFKDAMAGARATILEPIMQVEISTTEEFMGDIMSDLAQRRGRPQGMDSQNGTQVVKATVPLAEMLNYAPSLNAMTQGRSSFHMEFSHYEDVPKQIQQQLITQAQKDKTEEN